MREVPLERNEAAFAFAEELLAGRIDVVIFLTGVGARALLEAVSTRFDRAEILAALAKCCVVVRGPKPVAVLREWGTRIDYRAPEPNTWRELVQTLDEERVPLAGRTVAVQEYGRASPELYGALEERQAVVRPVPVYRWELPEDVAPLEWAVRRTIAGEFHVLMFTSAHQLDNVLEVAERLGVRDEWLAAAQQCGTAGRFRAVAPEDGTSGAGDVRGGGVAVAQKTRTTRAYYALRMARHPRGAHVSSTARSSRTSNRSSSARVS
jgi:uroporphyrinogen-III synthase